jgi:hypothetical protein
MTSVYIVDIKNKLPNIVNSNILIFYGIGDSVSRPKRVYKNCSLNVPTRSGVTRGGGL